MSVDDERFRRDEDLLRRALREEADEVLPSLDALSRIRRRTARSPLWRRPVVLGMAAASVTALAVIAGSAYFLGGSSDDTTASSVDSSPSATTMQSPSPPATESPASEPTDAVSPPPSEASGTQPGNETVPVYYVTETTRGERLAREFRDVPAPDGPLVAAVTTMLAESALDPDYDRGVWLPDTQVRAIEVKDDVIEVDLTGETDYTSVRDDVATLAIQQLVYTVTAAAADAGQNGALPVQILVDGVPPTQMWGQLDLSGPIARAPQMEVWQLVQIVNPQDGAVLGQSVTIDGVAMAYEAQVDWQVFDDQGNVVDSGFAMTTDSSTFAPFRFNVDLEPGFYSIVVTDADPTGGAEGPGPMSDTKNFSVR
ncbi:MAG TPA: Gmad2 immunoglobulin-like domain-containing protein [Jiangellaceae bacterium]|nr:Gmad2 immunoglobulin-like domain-containing protein [Jiangellaceae bacterium]